jgi:hypothetical protein
MVIDDGVWQSEKQLRSIEILKARKQCDAKTFVEQK